MPPHDDHFHRHPLPPGPRASHMPPHGPHHHPRRPPPHLRNAESGGGLYRQILELKRMGASEEDLHALIDGEAERLSDRHDHPVDDPGRGTTDKPVDSLSRARALSSHLKTSEDDWMERLSGKRVLVAAEFPPHLLERLLSFDIDLAQIHPPGPEGEIPPHMHHLARRGLRAILDFKTLADELADVVIFEACRDAGFVFVSPMVPVTLRMFQSAEIMMLDSDHRAPHMAIRIANPGFLCVPFVD
jgi:hypothetical protein